MFCEECGKKLSDDARFCPDCGTVVAPEEVNVPNVQEPAAFPSTPAFIPVSQVPAAVPFPPVQQGPAAENAPQFSMMPTNSTPPAPIQTPAEIQPQAANAGHVARGRGNSSQIVKYNAEEVNGVSPIKVVPAAAAPLQLEPSKAPVNEKTAKLLRIILPAIGILAIAAIVFIFIYTSPEQKIKRAVDSALAGDYYKAEETISGLSSNESYALRQYIMLRMTIDNNVNSDFQTQGDVLYDIYSYLETLSFYEDELDSRLNSKVERISEDAYNYGKDFDVVDEILYYLYAASEVFEELDRLEDGGYFTIADERANIDYWSSSLQTAKLMYLNFVGEELSVAFDGEVSDIESGIEYLKEQMDYAESRGHGIYSELHYTKIGDWIDFYNFSYDTVENVEKYIFTLKLRQLYIALSNY